MTDIRESQASLPHAALPSADWGDAYAVSVVRPYANARAAAEAAFETFPAWVYGLMALRNAVVGPLGLKTGNKRKAGERRVGFFPFIAETDEQLIVGMDDRHLDFRCVVDVQPVQTGQEIKITTVLKRHNGFGRAYLSFVLPFHRAILRMTMKRLAAETET